MTGNPRKTILEVVQELDRYSPNAFEFLHRGLDFTVRKLHGPPDEIIQKLSEWLGAQKIELSDLDELLEEGRLPQNIAAAIEHFGGPEGIRQTMNRHVSGEDLCWGLRDLALEQWGLMAPAVLRCWGIRSTMDFGRMVFALVENDLLQKQPDDRVEDFENIFNFDTAFGDAYNIHIQDGKAE
jgi:uncharacterized repeat protein (TIGR04138 family)